MKYNQLSEAIIRVPESTLKQINSYVSSVLYFKVKQYMKNYDRLASRDMRNHPAHEKIKANVMAECERTLKTLQRKYGAKNISSQSASNILGKTIQIPFDAEQYIRELNFKKIPENVLDGIRNTKLELAISNQSNKQERGQLSATGDNHYTISINVKVNPSEMYTTNMQIMSTVYHELQHFVQRSVIEPINRKSNQVQTKKTYNDHDKGYYSSGIEYTPQIGNIVDAMKAEAEEMVNAGDFPSDPKDAFNKTLKQVIDRDDKYAARRFMIHIHQTSQKKYREILTTIYKQFMKNFNDIVSIQDGEHEEREEEQLDANVNVLKTLAKIAEDSRYGETKLYGTDYNNLTAVEFNNEEYGWTARVTEVSGKTYLITLTGEGYKETGYLPYPQIEQFLSYITAIDSPFFDIYETMDEMVANQSDVEQDKVEFVKKLKHWTNMLQIQFKETEDGFELDGAEYILDENRGRLVLESNEFPELYWVGSLGLLTDIMKHILRLLKNNPETAYAEINRGESAVKAARRLRNL